MPHRNQVKLLNPTDEVEENDGEEEEEDKAIIELDQISILASSRTSLRNKKSSIRNSLKPNHDYHISDTELAANADKNVCIRFVQKFKGILLALLSAFCTSTIIVTIKRAYLFTASEQILIRYIIQFVIMYFICKFKRHSILGPKRYRKLLIFRGSINTISMISAYFAIRYNFECRSWN